MRRPVKIGKLEIESPCAPYCLSPVTLPDCEDSQEEVRDVVGERPAIAGKDAGRVGLQRRSTESKSVST